VTDEEIARAILSFPKGLAGGPDGLKPQHLKDMTGVGRGGQFCCRPSLPSSTSSLRVKPQHPSALSFLV